MTTHLKQRKNDGVAGIFRNLANVLEIRGESVFRIRAYRRAAQVVEDLPEDIETVAGCGGLKQLPGIGKDLAGKIQEIVDTGTLSFYEQIKKETPPVLLAFLSLPGIQPTTAQYLFERLGIQSLDDLEQMLRTHMLRILPEINKEVEEGILRGIHAIKESGPGPKLPT